MPWKSSRLYTLYSRDTNPAFRNPFYFWLQKQRRFFSFFTSQPRRTHRHSYVTSVSFSFKPQHKRSTWYRLLRFTSLPSFHRSPMDLGLDMSKIFKNHRMYKIHQLMHYRTVIPSLTPSSHQKEHRFCFYLTFHATVSYCDAHGVDPEQIPAFCME